MPGRGKIEPYHNALVADVHEILGVDVTFQPLPNENWYNVRDGAEVEFDLIYVDSLMSETAKRMRREGSKTHRVSVFPLSARSSSSVGTFWASWHEAWSKQDSKSFVLLNAGWTLFEGLSRMDKVQVLRVDWDQLPHRWSGQAGHPHWHFDHYVFLSEEQEMVEVAPGLMEEKADTTTFSGGRKSSIGFIHLAMGAWNSGINHPECWQRTYEDDCWQLHEWCTKTLRYLKDQVRGN